jgi:hypothetical protein
VAKARSKALGQTTTGTGGEDGGQIASGDVVGTGLGKIDCIGLFSVGVHLSTSILPKKSPSTHLFL